MTWFHFLQIPAQFLLRSLQAGRECVARINPEQTLISKRIDSTLRGNLGAEVDAVIDSFPHLMAHPSSVIPQRAYLRGRIAAGGRHSAYEYRNAQRS